MGRFENISKVCKEIRNKIEEGLSVEDILEENPDAIYEAFGLNKDLNKEEQIEVLKGLDLLKSTINDEFENYSELEFLSIELPIVINEEILTSFFSLKEFKFNEHEIDSGDLLSIIEELQSAIYAIKYTMMTKNNANIADHINTEFVEITINRE